MGNPKSFDIKNLLPFHKVQSNVPWSVGGEKEEITKLDPNLSSEEQTFIRHYLSYADILLQRSQDELDSSASTKEEILGERVIEIPHNANQEQLAQEEPKIDGDTEAA